MTKTLICLGGSIESLPILRRVKELGHRLAVVDGNEHAAGASIADIFVSASCYHADKVIPVLKGLNIKFDGVLCAAIDSPNTAAAISDAFGLPGLTPEQAETGINKWAQKFVLNDAGIPVPKFGELRAYQSEQVRFDLSRWDVIKPLDSRGARGVIRLLPDVDPAWAYDHARAQSPTGRVMVEEWLDGPQLSTESLVQDGQVLFTAVGLRNYARLDEFAPYVVEDGFDEPFQNFDPRTPFMEKQFNDVVCDLIQRSCAALGWSNCVCKGDLVIHNGKLHVIEIAPRLSGGLFCAAHLFVYGVDFIADSIQLALGENIDVPNPYPRQFVSQRYIFPDPADIGKRITAREEGDVPLGATFAHYSKPIGQVIAPVTSHPDRLGQALCVCATPQEARDRAERAVSEMYGAMVIE